MTHLVPVMLANVALVLPTTWSIRRRNCLPPSIDPSIDPCLDPVPLSGRLSR